MDPLKHFISKPSRDVWCRDAWLTKCIQCKQATSKMSSTRASPEMTARIKSAEYTTNILQPKHRILPIRTYKPSGKAGTTGGLSVAAKEEGYLCPTCTRDLPEYRAIRGEPPEYTPKYLTRKEIKQLEGK